MKDDKESLQSASDSVQQAVLYLADIKDPVLFAAMYSVMGDLGKVKVLLSSLAKAHDSRGLK